MTVVITGSDSSLGQMLMSTVPKETCFVGITSLELKSKNSIDLRIADILERVGPVTKVINNWGVNHLSWIGDTPEDDQNIFYDNVIAPYWIINALVASGQTCRVVNVASATYRVPQRTTALYCASKAALVQMTKVMARELAPKGWVINAIAPGLIEDTRMSEMTNEQVCELRGWNHKEMDGYARKLIPMGRYTNRKEVAKAIWKIFELPEYINGTIIDMMGGV